MLNKISQLANNAGKSIKKIYSKKTKIQTLTKSDLSQVTEADFVSHQIIIQGLRKFTPRIPILSEENPISWKIRKTWKQPYWIVDPLDGTKEFIKHNTDFTVNIALINNGKPILGVVYAPMLEIMYLAEKDKAWKKIKNKKTQIHAQNAKPALVVISKSNINCKKLKIFLQKIGKYKSIAISSSLKFCLVAEGTAQFYPRFGPTNIWDTAAGHAISIAAGANVEDLEGKRLTYIPRESFLNPSFRVSFK